MRHLLLLRHAKAVAHSKGGDIERELAPRGRREAGLLGRHMLGKGLRPDLALVSASARTRETVALLMAHWPASAPLDIQRGLYLAEAPAMLEALRAAPDEARTLMVVGHNPGMADLAFNLTAAGDPDARMHMMAGFPTCALAVFEVKAGSWAELTFQGARLVDFVTPKHLDG
jgi:phosphohistidine phosphatase